MNSMSDSKETPPELLSAFITVIPKEGKDPHECASYRPISLLNIDVKIFAKILANRLKPILHKLIGPEQAGFMPGREAKDNVIKSLLLINKIKTSDTEGLLLSTDAEKAFDRVAWDYMLATCKHVGLGTKMLAWISALYQKPSARLKINDTLSERVHIANGTRQGCPLSPLLFILSLEPFIRQTNLNPSVKGWLVGDREFKIAAYADDLLFFVSGPHITLPNLMKEFGLYGYVSNLKINYSKSEALNISLNTHSLSSAMANSPFKWDPKKLKYLGVNLTPQISSLYDQNFPSLLKSIDRDLHNWHSGTFSWFGRAAIIKMTVLPKLLYVIRTLPIKLPPSLFKTLRTLFVRFIWAHKKPRIKLEALMKAKEMGGLGVPNLRDYYLASHAARIIDWHCHRDSKDWVGLEMALFSTPLSFAPWLKWSNYPDELKHHPITGTTLKLLHDLPRGKVITSALGPLTQMKDNPGFIPGLDNSHLQSPNTDRPLLAGECYHQGKVKEYQALKRVDNVTELPFWVYLQARSYLKENHKGGDFSRPLTEFESVCRKGEPVNRTTSMAYAWLQEAKGPADDRLRRRWSDALQINITSTQWKNVCILAHKCSISTKVQETAYKLMTRWYLTPMRLNKWFPQVSDRCWRCMKDKGSLLHIWWQCPLIANYWNEILDLIKLITETTQPLDAACCLMHISNWPLKKYKRSLTRHLLNAANSLIPIYWKST